MQHRQNPEDKMVSVYTVAISSSASESSKTEPLICPDINCSYPFGDACDKCSFFLNLNELTKDKLPELQRTREWVEKVNVQKYITNYAGKVFIGGATNEDPRLDEAEEKGSNTLGPMQTPPSSGKEKSTPGNVDQVVVQVEEVSSSDNQTQESSDLYLSAGSSVGAGFNRIENRLSGVVSYTLGLHTPEDKVVGGAEDRNPSSPCCPLCSAPLGNPRDQHYLHCKYAHEELERARAMVRLLNLR